MKITRKALIQGQHPATGVAESCSIYYNMKKILEDWVESKASMPDYQNAQWFIFRQEAAKGRFK